MERALSAFCTALLAVASIATISTSASAQVNPQPANAAVAKYGTGGAGAGGITPTLTTNGLPSIGNAGFEVLADNVVGGTWGILLYSPVAQDIAWPLLGRCYVVSPAFWPTRFAVDGADGVAGAGSASIPIPIHDAPSLVGASWYGQAVFYDDQAAAGGGFSHSEGIKITFAERSEAIIIDHNCTDLTAVPANWVTAAKANLHIAYGHSSHGSHITDGMVDLVGFTGGCGGPQFAWNDGGTNGALDLHDHGMDGDLGNYPGWVNNTRTYLDDPNNADVNVIMWAWCGQHIYYTAQEMIDMYLAPMTQLELDYPKVTFVYQTGRRNYDMRVNTDARNKQIRDYCEQNGKVLYDFAHVESYDPDGKFYPLMTDSCDYWDAAGNLLGNWGIEWQNSHVKGVDWYDCLSAHTQPVNGNQKAYAAWWMWARLAGWNGQ